MKRKSWADNDILNIVLDNCKEFLNKRDTLYLFDVFMLLTKALEGVESKKDLTPSEQEDIKKIRALIKGL
jgi:hypothetical protein